MERTIIDGTFAIFSGLYGYYSLQRLLPMKLFNLEKLMGSNPSFSIKRLLLGLIANLLVALSFSAALLWFNFLIAENKISSYTQMFAAISIIISSSALLLLPHRIIGSLAIIFKRELFENDQTFIADENFNDFLKTPARSHFHGAIFFLAYQLMLGATIKLFFL